MPLFSTLFTRFSVAALAVVAIATTTTNLAAAQMGPQQPMERPKEVTNYEKMRDSFKKLFGEKKETDAENFDPVDPSGEEQPGKNVNDLAKQLEKEAQAKQPEPPRRPPLLTQSEMGRATIDNPEVSKENPPAPNRTKLDDPTNKLGLTYSREQLEKCNVMIKANLWKDAYECVTVQRQWLIDATEAHLGLYKSLNRISSAQAQSELEKQLAFEFGMLRDKAFLYMGQVYYGMHDNVRALKELTEVVKSQPKRDDGVKAYQLLQEMGFTEKLQIAE